MLFDVERRIRWAELGRRGSNSRCNSGLKQKGRDMEQTTKKDKKKKVDGKVRKLCKLCKSALYWQLNRPRPPTSSRNMAHGLTLCSL